MIRRERRDGGGGRREMIEKGSRERLEIEIERKETKGN